MNRVHTLGVAAIAAALLSSSALGGITITQGTSAPTYATTLNFEEPGGPTGFVSTGDWAGTHGITELQAGDGVPQVGDWTGIFGPWVGSGNSFYGNFGVFMTMDSDISEMSMDIWDPSGAPSPFGGGLGVFVFDNGVEVASLFATPAWGGIGDQAFNITTSGGMVFDEVRVLGFGFGPTTFADNMSWNAVPEPGALALFGFAAMALFRRRQG